MARRRFANFDSASKQLYFTPRNSGSEEDEEEEEEETEGEEEEEYDEEEGEEGEQVSDLDRALILSLNTCYHVGLQSESMRNKYLDGIAALFKSRRITRNFMDREINACYEVFLDEIQLPNAIARNQVGFSLQIALFLINFFIKALRLQE
jgi:hypothetical protein